MGTSDSTLDRVKGVIARTLGIEDRAGGFDASTPLFGALPELDSLAILELVTGIEQEFGIRVSDDDITGETFASVGSLTAFVDEQSG